MALSLMMLAVAILAGGCINVKPIRIEPIEITMNVNLRIAQELNDFFGDLDAQSQVMAAPSGQQP